VHEILYVPCVSIHAITESYREVFNNSIAHLIRDRDDELRDLSLEFPNCPMVISAHIVLGISPQEKV